MLPLRGLPIRIVILSLLVLLSACDEQQLNGDAGEPQGIKATNKKKPTHFVIGTGSVQGVYYPIGGVICRLVNRAKELHKMRCSVESTSGSVYNLKELQKGNFDVVVAQSDWQYHAYHGTSVFEKNGANTDLRAVFALESDPLALLVKTDSSIKVFDDLQDKTMALGYKRSLQSRVFQDLLDIKQWDEKRFKQIERMSDHKQIGELCAGNVDAVLLLSSSLQDHFQHIDPNCHMRFIAIEGEDVRAMIKKKPYYRKGLIWPSMYPQLNASTVGEDGSTIETDNNINEKIESVGLGATFVAPASASPKAIYLMVKEIVENFKDFQSLHPSLRHLDKKELPYAGITAPLHPGAIRYYKEARLLKH